METFNKSERLCSLKVIGDLFESGECFFTPIFRVVWKISPGPVDFPARVVVSVPKKKFRLAVERNLIKRRIREAYRKNKQLLYDELNIIGCKIVFIIIFRGNRIPDYQFTEKSTREMMVKMILEVKKKLNLS